MAEHCAILSLLQALEGSHNEVETVNLSTPGAGYVFLPSIAIPNLASSNTPITGTANQILVVQFVLPTPITARRLTANISVAAAGQKFFIGVYSTAGKKLLQASLSCGALNATTATLTSPVALPAGTYFYAYGVSNTACAATATPIAVGIANMLQKNSIRLATSSNAVSAGVLPATLGTLTPTALSAIPVVLLEP